MFDRVQQVKLIDFGLSRFMEPDQTHAATSDKSGSNGWTAPEVLEGVFLAKSDFFPLGLVLFYMLLGHKTWSSISGTPNLEKCLAHVNEIPHVYRFRCC